MPVEAVGAQIGADSLGYLSLAALAEATRAPGTPRGPPGPLHACLTGHYPIPVRCPQDTAVPEHGAVDALTADERLRSPPVA